MGEFVRGTQKAIFIFSDQSIVDYFEELRRKAVDLQRCAIILGNQHTPTAERAAAANQDEQLMNWFLEQQAELVSRLRRFMALDENTAARPLLDRN